MDFMWLVTPTNIGGLLFLFTKITFLSDTHICLFTYVKFVW